MSKPLKIVILLVALFVIVTAMQPSEYSVTRTTTIIGAPAKIFPHVNNLHQWEAWSPWAKLDPNATITYAGPAQGKGASMSWAGNNQVGVGTMTITESKPNETILFNLDFEKPMKGTSTAQFHFTQQRNATLVVWTMMGHKNFAAKAVSLIMSCDKIVGDQFEKGLANLKTLVEGPAKPEATAHKPAHKPAAASTNEISPEEAAADAQ